MRPPRIEWSGRVPFIVAGSVILFVCLLQLLPRLHPKFSLFERLELMSYDWRVRLAVRFDAPAATDLAAVFIDEDSLLSVNQSYGFSWPWPRQLHGRLVDELRAEGARIIGFDILFRERHAPSPETSLQDDGQLMDSDSYFARTLRRSGNVVLAALTTFEGGQLELLQPHSLFATNSSGIGHIILEADPDGVLRRVKAFYDDPVHGRVWHLGLVLAARYLNLNLDRAQVEPGRLFLPDRSVGGRLLPIDRDGYFYVDWALLWNDRRITKLPFHELLRQGLLRDHGQTNLPSPMRNKLVIVGSIASGNNVSDLGATPLSKQTFLVSKHWNVANSIILNRFILRSGYATELLLILFMGTLSAIITWRLRALVASALIALLVLGYFGLGAWLFVEARYWLPLILPSVGALLMTHGCMVTYRVVVEQRERHRIRSVFSKVVSPKVVNELLKEEGRSLDGARRNVSVLFADIRGFTNVTDESHARAEEYVQSQRLSGAAADDYHDAQAKEILQTVNLYLSQVADQVREHDGTFDKYIGDCVMAFWGAPTPNDRHAVAAVQAAIDAQRAIYRLNLARAEENRQRELESARRVAQGQPALSSLTLLSLGTGINTGVVTVGLMGSADQTQNYTVFGRGVNLASRLEGLSGRGRILISETTFRELDRLAPEVAGVCERLSPFAVKGFREPVTAYEVHWRRLVSLAGAYDTEIVRASTGPLDTGFRESGDGNPPPTP